MTPAEIRLEARCKAYVESARAKLIAEIKGAGKGEQNNTLYRCMASLASLAAGGHLDLDDARQQAFDAARRAGLPGREISTTIRSAIAKGCANPRRLNFEDDQTWRERTQLRPALVEPVVELRPSYPPGGELWNACSSVYADPEVAEGLRRRAIDPGDVADRDHARAIPVDLVLPSWGTFEGQPWNRIGYRLIVPLFDSAGRLVTLRARRLSDGEGPKSLPPAGFSVVGAIMADPLARMILTGKASDCRAVIIAEGEPDFLTDATHYSDADEDAPAVFGIFAGSWTPAIAARIPDGATVTIRTHHDATGDKYATKIGRTLEGRCRLLRSTEAA